MFCRSQIVDKSIFCRDQIVGKSIFCRDQIVDKSVFCRDQIVDKSIFCRDRIVGISTLYGNQIATTSIYCKDHVVSAVFDALKIIPVCYRNGELLVLGRDDVCGDGEPTDTCGTEMKQIYILLTKHTNMLAKLLRVVTFYQYTHTSIALEEDGSHYSFNPVRGFTIERPIHKKRSTTPCKLYCVDVSEKTYAEIEGRLQWFLENPDEYKFNYVGLALSILHIPIGVGGRYFCSQFVSDILTASNAEPMLKKPSRYFPRHFHREKGFRLMYDGVAGTFAAQQGDDAAAQAES
ncbi:MAG: hypothetical protein LBG82_07020 [Clostridiales Family XIII bacterium]|jgi:hypothetical protein|nr:hypothetical protein [Clostridiales Family XIII bacterium]